MEKYSGMLVWMVLMAVLFSVEAKICYGNSANTQKRNGQYVLTQEMFREDIAGKIGKHVYYSYNVIEGRNLSEEEMEEIFEYMRRVDRELKEDVFITGFGKMTATGRWRFYAEQYLNGAVIPEVFYWTDVDTYVPNLCVARGTPLKELDTSWVIPAPTLFQAVKELALEHADELCDYNSKGLYARYLLTYNVTTETLEYEFIINETSSIYVDALTGQVTKEYYWDGVYVD